MFVIDPTGKPLGVLPLTDALAQAKRHGLDLVEVSPNANPPVCKILDFGKYRYELSKKDKEAKKNTSATKVKELKFHLNIDGHDYGVKMRHAEGFMMKGMKCKLAIVLRGREMIHKNRAVDLMARIRADLMHIGTADFEPKFIGKSINMMLTPVPVRKRVRKFTTEETADIEADIEDDSGSPEAVEAEENGN
jgi:translation initiation factor IF-3